MNELVSALVVAWWESRLSLLISEHLEAPKTSMNQWMAKSIIPAASLNAIISIPETAAMDSLDSSRGFVVLLCFGPLDRCNKLFKDTCDNSEVLAGE